MKKNKWLHKKLKQNAIDNTQDSQNKKVNI